MEIAANRIALPVALKLMDEKMIGNRLNTFAISFVTAKGELIELTEGCKCGVKPGINTKHYIGIRSAQNSHHSYTVHMRAILKFNNNRIYW